MKAKWAIWMVSAAVLATTAWGAGGARVGHVAEEAVGWSPVQIGIGGESLQLAPKENQIMPLRLNLPFSEDAEVCGLDFGIFGKADNAFGVQLNLFNFIEDHGAGVSMAIYHTASSYSGITLAAFNNVEGEYRGLQMGLFPKASMLRGIQIGVINRVKHLRGVQLGLVNINTGSPVPFFPMLRFDW
jgi:hypothetical protein